MAVYKKDCERTDGQILDYIPTGGHREKINHRLLIRIEKSLLGSTHWFL